MLRDVVYTGDSRLCSDILFLHTDLKHQEPTRICELICPPSFPHLKPVIEGPLNRRDGERRALLLTASCMPLTLIMSVYI